VTDSHSQQTHNTRDTDPASVIEEESARDIAPVTVQVPAAFLLFGRSTSGPETSISDASGHNEDCKRNIPASNANGTAAGCDGNVTADSASAFDGTNSAAEPSSVPYRSDGTGNDEEVNAISDKTAGSAVAKDGTVSIDVSREMASTDSADKEVLPIVGIITLAAQCSVTLPGEGEVRCVQCHKMQAPQCCPVCKRMCASLSAHISTHSGKNPYVISSLLGIQTTYDDDESERVESVVGEQAVDESGGVVVVPRARRHKRRRVPKQCTVCGRTYTKLAEHMARMHGEREPCMCTDCGKFLRNANTLRAHMLSKTCLKSRVCPICERTCENDAGLKSHMRSHANIDKDRDGQIIEGHHCDECKHSFSSSEALEAHMALHVTRKNHVCCICGRTFIHARSLQLHIRMHTGETPFECKACGKGFRSRKGLLEHRSVHTMEKRYVCTLCGRRFRLYRTFSRHRVIHSGVKRFECEQCGMRFAFNHLRKRHMNTHSGEKPYVCSDCGDRFTQWNGLYQHRQRHCGRQTETPPPSLL